MQPLFSIFLIFKFILQYLKALVLLEIIKTQGYIMKEPINFFYFTED